jgi:hypothetical protein
MKTWVQLKDDIAFASVQSDTEVGNSILLDDSLSWEDVRDKKHVEGSWVLAEKIYFVSQMLNNRVLKIESTLFPSEVNGVICPAEVKEFWVYNEDGTFSLPPTIQESTIYDEHLFTE